MSKKLLPLLFCTLLSTMGFGQSYSFMQGTYLLIDSVVDEEQQVSVYTAIVSLYPMVAHDIYGIPDGDSAEGIYYVSGDETPVPLMHFIFNCATDSFNFIQQKGGGCNGTSGSSGLFTFNCIKATWTTDIANEDEWFHYDTYTRIPQLTRQQIDSMDLICSPPPKLLISDIILKPQTNPVKQTLYFSINDYNPPPTTYVRIFNTEGKCVFQADVPLQSGQQVSINVSNFAPGMYILQGTASNLTAYTLKFIKD